ncbi:hypothetical protein SAMN03080615_01645 [Amphritea atlantica]|uniref:Uncharacterized protein n=1 Tax=Amphritea atlantica TaxID=355243 RepID=A0A1H9GEZ0_9GAMM|nr:hypothetical protein [Amphritea atlantica]SEQ48695.1 hypothetical protein SAMN03080615_01645 [Amphritea atlantica]
MDKKTKEKLAKTIKICQALLNDEPLDLCDGEIDCIPRYLDIKSPSSAKKQGLVLKRGAKPIGEYSWQLPAGGRAYGKLYLGARFKSKEA